jgi:hypothetical protein
MAFDKSGKSSQLTEIRKYYGLADSSLDDEFNNNTVTIYRTVDKVTFEHRIADYIVEATPADKLEPSIYSHTNTIYDEVLIIGDHTKKDSNNVWSEYTGE